MGTYMEQMSKLKEKKSRYMTLDTAMKLEEVKMKKKEDSKIDDRMADDE